MSEVGRHDLALELITNIDSREAIRLRSDIFWSARRWRAAAEQIELLYGDRWRDFKPLNDAERSDILRAAIGYALSEEAMGLARLRDKYAPKMADGPDRRAFDVVSTPIGTSGPEFQSVAKKVANVNTLSAFLRDMNARYPDTATPAAAAKETSKQAPKEALKDTPPAAKPAANAPAAKPPGAGAKTETPDKAAQNAPKKPDAAAPPAPPKAPAAAAPKADPAPTGSISRLSKKKTSGR